jgi:hypothetical protein
MRTSAPQRQPERWGVPPRDTIVPDPIRRRRELSASVRRRRLVVVDIAVGVALAAIVLLLGFGLAPVGIVAALVLIGIGLSSVIAHRRAKRARRAWQARRSGNGNGAGLTARDEGALIDRRSRL